jgi:hypothetical protein
VLGIVLYGARECRVSGLQFLVILHGLLVNLQEQLLQASEGTRIIDLNIEHLDLISRLTKEAFPFYVFCSPARICLRRVTLTAINWTPRLPLNGCT